MRNTTQSFFGEPKFVKKIGLHGGVIDVIWSHGFMNCYYTCSGRLTFGLCLFILFSISDKVIAMISDKVTIMVNKGIHGRLSAGPADPAGESPGFQARL